jgi:ABC-type phosphate/phosphonate transport system substrate-binding protein
MKLASAASALAALVSLAAAADAAEKTLVVYLPSAPVESASRLGEAVNELGAFLGSRVPGLELSVRPFRRGEDAMEHIRASAADVALILSEPSFLVELPRGFDPLPTSRLVRSGKETERKLVIVAASSPHAKLSDLKGRSLSLASSSDGVSEFLARAVFEGEVTPKSWFGNILTETDDFTATANVLYGRSDAALVSEANPLVATHLGKDLKTVFTSPPISLPVIAVRTGALTAEQRNALESALESLGRHPEDKKVLEGLRADGFSRIRDGSGRWDRAQLLSISTDERRAPEVATAGPKDLGLLPLPGLEGGKLPFVLGFTVPDLPMPLVPEIASGDGKATRGAP